jgi:hypothetical protein
LLSVENSSSCLFFPACIQGGRRVASVQSRKLITEVSGMDNGISTGAPHCRNCGVLFRRNLRLGDRGQRYCSRAACQRARKAEWNRRKYASNPAFCAAEMKRVRISRRTQDARRNDALPGNVRGPPGAGPELLLLRTQMMEMGLLLRGMASHSTGIINGVDLQACLERYADRGRMLQRGQVPA